MRCDALQLPQWKQEVKTQFHETVAAADRGCAADGVSVAADNEALKYHWRDAITFRTAVGLLDDCCDDHISHLYGDRVRISLRCVVSELSSDVTHLH
jgi:hypothetical protein